MNAADTLREDLRRTGFSVVSDVIDDDAIGNLTALMESTAAQGGRRNVLVDFSEVRSVASAKYVRFLVEQALGPNAFAVRGLFFDKTPAANWMVNWHQDRTIAVRERREVPGFSLWTVKAGVHHAQPPTHVLEEMVTVRLHLDDTDESSGALRVIPGSHRNGFIDEDAIDGWVQEHGVFVCRVSRGGAMVMRPLILHASSKAAEPKHRRVLHLEFTAQSLPYGLEWAIRV